MAQTLFNSYQNSIICAEENAEAKYLFSFRGLAGHPYGVFFMLSESSYAWTVPLDWLNGAMAHILGCEHPYSPTNLVNVTVCLLFS